MSELYHPGLQPERTHLAWGRTGLGFLVNAGLLIRFAPLAHPPVLAYGAAGVLVLGGIVVSALGRFSYAPRNRALAVRRSVAAPQLLRVVWLFLSVGTVGAAAAMISAGLGG